MDQGDLADLPSPTFTFSPTSIPIPETGGEAEVVLTSWAILILVTLLISTLFVSYLLERRRIRQIFVHETIVALGMGAAVGLVVRYFFNLILPPIILNSGYDLKRKSFFRNFGSILTFAFFGTLIASLVMGVLIYVVVALHLTPVRLTFLDCMMFGSILSSTDPVTIIAIFNQLKVDPDLFVIIFGESLMNDAVAIVLFTIQQLPSQQLDPPKRNCQSPLLRNYLKHYAYDNMSQRTRRTTKYMFRVLSQLAENFVFIYLGVTLFANREQAFSFTLTFLLVNVWWIIVLFSRYVSIKPLASLLNSLNPASPLIPQNYQTILWWAGLRGAIAFALSFEMTSPSAAAMRTTTLVVCVMSVVGLGGTVGMALEVSEVKIGVIEQGGDESSEEEEDWDDEIAFYGGEGAFSGRRGRKGTSGGGEVGYNHHSAFRSLSEDAGAARVGYHGHSAVGFEMRHYGVRNSSLSDDEETNTLSGSGLDPYWNESHWFIDFDNKYMKPLFTRRRAGTVFRNRGYGGSAESPTRLLESRGSPRRTKGAPPSNVALLSPSNKHSASAARASSVGKRSSRSRMTTQTFGEPSGAGGRRNDGAGRFGTVEENNGLQGTAGQKWTKTKRDK
ncbi:UNVERIFIED_CONTAM: monovalent cation:H+ antiporter, CPA1 (nhx1) [Siphonaria sp. JEL0065]|nr:monovalent cation:H+ antiporter, CPA1 (nhx1) [Siphonaria sp. JEL0065]